MSGDPLSNLCHRFEFIRNVDLYHYRNEKPNKQLVDQWIDDTLTKHFLRIIPSTVARGNVAIAVNVWSALQLNVNSVVNKADFEKFQQLRRNEKFSWTFQSITGWSAITFANWARNIHSVSECFDLLKAKCFVKLGCFEVSIRRNRKPQFFHSLLYNNFTLSILVDSQRSGRFMFEKESSKRRSEVYTWYAPFSPRKPRKSS